MQLESKMSSEPIVRYEDGTEGAYGVVYKAVLKKTGLSKLSRLLNFKENSGEQLFAVKIFKECSSDSKEDQESIDKEIKLLKELQHPNIVHHIDYFLHPNDDDPGSLERWLVMPYCSERSLKMYVTKVDSFSEAQVHQLLTQVQNGLKEMYAKHIIHRDLSYNNILVHDNNGQITYLIGDLGLSRKDCNASMLTVDIGMKLFRAPELFERQLRKKRYDPNIDIYALGINVLYAINKALPWEGNLMPKTDDEMKKKVEQLIPDKHRSVKPILLSMIRYEDQRIKMEEFFEHPYFNLLQ